MAQLSREQVAKYLYDAGFRGDDLANMVAIAGRESSYKPDAHRTDQPKSKLSGDLGLFQINYVNWERVKNALGLTSKEQLFDPAINARAARVLFEADGYQPWTAGPGGWTAGGDPFYGTNRTAAREAVDKFLQNPAQYDAASTTAATQTSAPLPPQPAPFRPIEYREPNVETVERTNKIADYKPPEANPEQQAALTTLLQGFGIDYPEGPRATPQLLMFMRGLGMNVDESDAQFDEVRAEIQRRAADKQGDLALSDQRRRRSIGIDAQRRGALSSGALNSAFGRQAEDYARAQADLQRGSADSIAAAARARDVYQGGLRQQGLETVLNTETQQDVYDASQQAQVEAARAAQEEADLAYARTREAERRRTKTAVDLYNQSQGGIRI
jgi:hypothetical protein